MAEAESSIRLRAFIGRGFAEQDNSVWLEIRNILESLRGIGFTFEDANPSRLIPISEKVRQGIQRNDIYLAILTRRYPVFSKLISGSDAPRRHDSYLARLRTPIYERDASSWSVSPWVVQESGYAIGLGKKVLMLVEEGVDFPLSDIDADMEWISFNRERIRDSQAKLISMLSSEIGALLPLGQQATAVPIETNVAAENEQADDASRHIPEFDEVEAALSTRDFDKADELFAEYLTSIPEFLKKTFGYYFLRKKAAAGSSDGLSTLENLVETHLEDVDARVALAEYYQEFRQIRKAESIFDEGIGRVPKAQKMEMLLAAARFFAVESAFDKAIELVSQAKQLAENDDPKIRKCYVSLANIAKEHKDATVESAALERAIEIAPSDTSLRFRLAYSYGEQENRRMSLFHYKIRVAQGDEPLSLNNQGVALSKLNMTGRAVDSYKKAATSLPLAKVNLAGRYVASGFFTEGEQLAREALANPGDDHNALATTLLERLAEDRAKEEEREKKVIASAQKEREFRMRFAEALLDKTGELTGQFDAKYGKIAIEQTGVQVVGIGTKVTEKGLFAATTLASIGGSKEQQVTQIRFEAKLIGRAGRFQLETKRGDASLISVLNPSSIKGLMVVAEDWQSFELLEEGTDEATISSAQRISDSAGTVAISPPKGASN